MLIQNFQLEPLLLSREDLRPDWHWNSANNHWTGFHLWYLTRNGIKIRMDDQEYNLSEGDTFIFDLSKNHHCTHDPAHPASLYTVYFHCSHTRELQAQIRSGTVLRQNHPAMYNANIQLLEQAMLCSRPADIDIWLSPVFQQLLTHTESCRGQQRIAQIRQQMDTAPQNCYSLEALARQCGYSKNQFIRVFRQITGSTPHAYLIDARIRRAQNLLLFSDYTATQIARMLGYHDLNHFSYQFHRKTGCYPSQYTANHAIPSSEILHLESFNQTEKE